MANENTQDEPSEVDASGSSHCSLAFADIVAAITSGKYSKIADKEDEAVLKGKRSILTLFDVYVRWLESL